MNSQKRDHLEKTYERILNVGFCMIPYEDLSDITAPDPMVYGTAKDERIHSYEGIEALFKAQLEQIGDMKPSIDRKRITLRISNDGNQAIIVEEITLTLSSAEVTHTIFMRASCVMEYLDNRWKLTHWHTSTPVDTENDPWHMEEWKREKEKLQQLVDEQTAALKQNNRELQIEAALEKVRSSSLAMQKTNDLKEVVKVLFEQMQGLSVDMGFASVSIFIFEDGSRNIRQWLHLPDGVTSLSAPYFDHPISSDLFDAKESGEDFFTKIYTLEEKNTWLEHGFEYTDYKDLTEEFKSSLLQAPGYAMAITLAKNSGISIPSFEGKLPTPENIQIMRRVGKVFEQAYIRFLDLQKAEAQAREAQIEAALERVRSKALAMHNSEDLRQTITAIFEELKGLNIKTIRLGLGLVNPDRPEGEMFTSRIDEKDQILEVSAKLRLEGHPVIDSIYDHFKQQQDYFPILEGEEINSYYAALQGSVNVQGQGTDTKHFGCFLYFKEGCLYAWSAEPHSEGQIDILKKFSRVVEITYRRYIELQKAEEQAKEAQIEASLERIRAKAMAMHQSDELDEVLAVLCEQFDTLGIFPMSTHMTVLDIANNKFTFRETGKFGNRSFGEQTVALDAMDTWKEMVESWKSADPYSINRLHFPKETLPQVWEVFHESFASMPEGSKITPDDYPDGIYHTAGKHPFGYIGMNQVRPATEKEDQIVIKFANEFGRAYQRFLDLQKAEAQTREAQIIASMERVRAATMAMHQSNELSLVLSKLFEQFDVLGIKPSHAVLTLIDKEKNTMNFRTTGKNGYQVLAEQEVDLNVMNAWVDTAEKWKKSNPNAVNVNEFPPEILPDVWEVYKDILASMPKKARPEIKDFPDGLFITEGYCRFGYIGFAHHRKPTEEEKDIVRRIAAEFGTLYQRFLDLKKSEAQAREAQIETALEKVRSRTMAMQKGDELQEVAVLLYKELIALGVTNFVTCGYVEVNEAIQRQHTWVTSPGGDTMGLFHLPLTGDDTFDARYAAWKNQQTVFHQTVADEVRSNHLEYAITTFNSKEAEEMVRSQFPDPTVFYCFNFLHGYLHLVGGSLLEKEEEVLLARFTKVFEQTYTRFLDLQKAEAQAKEAQIEMALEKVRSRTMAMQHSNELIETSELMFDQIKILGIELWSCGFSLWYDNDSYFVGYNTGPDGKMGDPLKIPLKEDVFFTTIRESKRRGDDFLVFESEGESLIQTYNYMDTLPVVGEFMRDIVMAGAELPKYQITHCGFFSHGHLMFIALEPNPEAVDIFKRFTKVFEQTYTRFLDLQKAEAQAKEAQIEMALEKVRSRTMAMQHSDELPEAANNLFLQVQALGIPAWSAGYCIWEDVKKSSWCNMSSEGEIQKGFSLPSIGEGYNFYDPQKNGEPFYVSELGGEALVKHYDFMKKLPIVGEILEGFDKVGISLPTFQIFHIVYFTHGYLMFITYEPVPNDWDTFKRFGRVFEQTYTRFLDLQKAEAQAKEAQIEAALERVRSQSMGMQASTDFSTVTTEMFNQLRRFDGDLFATGIVFCDKHEGHVEQWHSIPNAGMMTPFIVPVDLDYIHQYRYDEWKKGTELFSVEIPGDFIKRHFEDIFNLPSAQKVLKDWESNNTPMPEAPPWEIDYGASFKNGYILVSALQPFQSLEILPRFAKVFEQAYTRFLDLKNAEAQTRQAQINLAVERVRAKALAMHKSEEIMEVVAKLKDEVMNLDIPDVVAATIFLNEGADKVRMWDLSSIEVNDNQTEVAFDITFKFKKSDPHLYMKRVWENDEDYFVVIQDEKGFKRLMKWLREMNKSEIAEEVEKFIEKTKLKQLHHTVKKLNNGKLVIDLFNPPSDEMETILTKMGAAFDLAYKRFEDLQKAEAQTREAKIEGALEKVRSRTMGMQSSEELPEVANLLFTEVRALGIHAWSCGYNILAKDKKSATCCMSSEGTLQTPFQLRLWGEASFDEMGEFVLSDHTMLVQELGGTALEKHYARMKSFPDLKPTFDEIDRLGLSLPTYQINHLCKFTQGFILFITYEKVPESHAIFKRFTKIFDQTYTRFLDLKKAEAQAREAQIENALEKVRSRSMAMHKSEELLEVISVVSEQLQQLDFKFIHVSFANNDSGQDYKFWTASKGVHKPMRFNVPYSDIAIFNNLRKAQETSVSFFTDISTQKEHIEWHKHLLNHCGSDVFSKEENEFIMSRGMARSIAINPNIILILANYASIPYSEADNKIIERFALVFEQSYTRFLDLEKAERQAREAQIENALEKVRSRSLAMQSPNELIEVAQLLREEMGALGVEALETSSIYIQDENTETTQCWFTIKDSDYPDNSVTDQMTINLKETWVGRKMEAFYRSSEKHTSIVMKGDHRKEWMAYCERQSDLFSTTKFYGDTIPERTYHLYKFSDGYIGAAAPGNISEESWDLLRRATTVFSFAYTRFRDLQIAEASARAALRQASLDRVRADISSMRNAKDLERITPLVFNELTTLGIPFIRCGVFIVHEKTKNVEVYLSSPEGKSLAVMNLPFSANDMTTQSVSAWKKKHVYIQHWDKSDFINWSKSLQEQGYVKDLNTYQGDKAAPESLHLHFIPFNQGLLYVGAAQTLKDEQIDLVKALSESFAIAYARYEDFVKLEKAKAEVEIAMNELKATQSQLIQSEKMASLGELTAGIAHEIQNPLNFVNNFSEVSNELIDEIQEERAKNLENRDEDLVDEILGDIKQNLEKINHHGKRADGIVKGMLQHSRSSSGTKEPTDINALCDEYLRLSYHGLRAKDKSFNATLHTDFEEGLDKVNVIPQDLGRVVLNLLTNAFYAVNERKQQNPTDYEPSVSIATKTIGKNIEITVKDNGNGMPQHVVDKIFQPFFTTKPTGQGTGLGLSMSYDIVTKGHGGEIKVDSKSGEGTEFSIVLPC